MAMSQDQNERRNNNIKTDSKSFERVERFVYLGTNNVGSVTYLLTPPSTVFLEKLTGLQLVEKFPHFIKPESSLPHSQVPTTRLYPEPAKSSPYSHVLLLEEPS
jgi:hypothetical protein